MPDLTTFEGRLEAQLRAYSEPAAAMVDVSAFARVARSAATTGVRRGPRADRWTRAWSSRSTRYLIAAALLAAALVMITLAVIGSPRRNDAKTVTSLPKSSDMVLDPLMAMPIGVTPPGPACGDVEFYADHAGARRLNGWATSNTSPGALSDVRNGSIAGWSVDPVTDAKNVVSVDAASGQVTRLIGLDLRSGAEGWTARWSPNGAALAATWSAPLDDACWELTVLDNGVPTRPLDINHNGQSNWFAWAPDASRLAVVRIATPVGQPAVAVRSMPGGYGRSVTGSALWLVPADGSPARDLGYPCETCGFVFDPAWSPNGSALAAIVMVTGQPATLAVFDLGRATWSVLPPSGTDMTLLGWTADGRVIVGQEGPNGERASLSSVAVDPSGELGVAPIALGDGVESTLDVVPSSSAAVLSPDGSRVISSSSSPDGTSYDVAVIDLATGRRTVVWSGVSDGIDLAWAPDGREIAVSSRETDPASPDGGLWVVGVDGADRRRVGPLTLSSMTWQATWP